MSIRRYRTFLAVARYGSFAAAAHEIGLTQAAVGIQIGMLESELRVRLFDRSARSAVLNTAGRNLVAKAQELVRMYDGMAIGLGEQTLGGALALGAIPPTFSRLLPDALLLLRRDHPEIRVRVSSGVSSDLMRMVERGELDAALVAEPPYRLPHGVEWRRIVSEPLVLLAPATLKVRALAETLRNHPFIGISRLSWTGQLVHGALRRHGLRVKDAMELDSLETISAMIARGFGVSILPLAPSRWHVDPRVTIARLTEPELGRAIGLVHRHAGGGSALVEALHASLLAVPAEKAGRGRRLPLDS